MKPQAATFLESRCKLACFLPLQEKFSSTVVLHLGHLSACLGKIMYMRQLQHPTSIIVGEVQGLHSDVRHELSDDEDTELLSGEAGGFAVGPDSFSIRSRFRTSALQQLMAKNLATLSLG